MGLIAAHSQDSYARTHWRESCTAHLGWTQQIQVEWKTQILERRTRSSGIYAVQRSRNIFAEAPRISRPSERSRRKLQGYWQKLVNPTNPGNLSALLVTNTGSSLKRTLSSIREILSGRSIVRNASNGGAQIGSESRDNRKSTVAIRRGC